MRISTQLIVLKKMPYKESSLIINGLSPLYGRLDLVVRGARKLGKKNFPRVDIFREIHVEFTKKGEGLQTVYSAELLKSYDALASNPALFMELCRLNSFVMFNSKPMMESAELYTALKNCYEKCLCEKYSALPWHALVKLIYLYENGLLHEDAFGQGELLAALLECARNPAVPPPELSLEYWQKLKEWISSLCKYHELQES